MTLRLFLLDGVRVGIIMGIGDVLAQTVVEKRELKNVDTVRTAKFAGLGLVFVGPVLRVWYGTLDRVVSAKQPPFKRAVKKMALDQTCFAPVFTLAIASLVGTINGEKPDAIKKRLKRDYVTIMQHNYMLWPAAQMINFSIIPIQYQVTFAQIIAIIWNCYLSNMLNKR